MRRRATSAGLNVTSGITTRIIGFVAPAPDEPRPPLTVRGEELTRDRRDRVVTRAKTAMVRLAMPGTTNAHCPEQMIALRRHSSCELLSITSTPLTQPPWFDGPEVELCIVAAELDESMGAMAVASMTRTRSAPNEEIWVQLFVDDTFVDLARAADVSDSDDEAIVTFLGRIEIPSIYFDGQEHRARVKFVKTISRVVPRGNGIRPIIEEPDLTAESDFVATVARRNRS